jgi:hypothetical protein
MIAAIAGAAIVVAVRAIPEPRPRAVPPRTVAVEMEPLCGTSLGDSWEALNAEPEDEVGPRARYAEHLVATTPVQLLLRRGDALLAVDLRRTVTIGRAELGRLTAVDIADLVDVAGTRTRPASISDGAIARGWIWIGDTWHRIQVDRGEEHPVLCRLGQALLEASPSDREPATRLSHYRD